MLVGMDTLISLGLLVVALIPLYLACGALGATFTPANPGFTDAEARAVFDKLAATIKLDPQSAGGSPSPSPS